MYSIAHQSDGSMVLGGGFITLQPNGTASAVTHNRLARLTAMGTLDISFDVQANGGVNGVSLQADGRIFACGSFNTLHPDSVSAAVTRNYLARLTNDSATEILSQTGGTTPEVSRVWFEQSTDSGATWTPLGEGVRVGTRANWRITGLSLPGSGMVRARGRTAGGYFGGSPVTGMRFRTRAICRIKCSRYPRPVIRAFLPA